jgi:hypothetical protein
MKLFRLTAVLLFVPVFIGTAQAQQDVIASANIHWITFRVGGNMGGEWDTACDKLEPGPTAIKGSRALTNAFYHRDYPSDGTFVSGAQIGRNIQYAQWAQSFGLDYEAYSGKYRNRTYAYTGASLVPHGTYTFSFSGKNSADGFLIPDPGMGDDPGIGDAGDPCFPYLRWGGVFTSGSRHFSTRFGDTAETATLSGGKNYDSSGFATGAAIHYATVDRCLFRAECTFMIHNSVAANIYR